MAAVVPTGQHRQLQRLLEQKAEGAQAAHPLIEVDPVSLVTYVAQRAGAGAGDLVAWLDQLHWGDLLVSFGCFCGDSAALATLERDYVSKLPPLLMRYGGQSAIDDVIGQLRQRLLLNQPPKIGDYGGRGELVRWLRVVATRLALEQRRRDARIPDRSDDILLAAPAAGVDPELGYLRERYQTEFRSIFLEGLQSLDAADRNLLRLHYLEGMTLEEIARLYRLHRTSAGRRVAKIRQKLLSETRRRFRERLHVGHQEFESLMGLVQSQLHLSIRRYLGGGDESSGG